METYKKYLIIQEEGIEKGIFFRKPVQEAYYSTDDPHAYRFSAWKYLKDIKNPIRRFYEIIIGNLHILRNINDLENDISWYGFYANILCFPIYFKRAYIKSTAISTGDDSIHSIEAHAYTEGFSDKEKTVIRLNTGEQITQYRDSFYYIYSYNMKRLIDMSDSIQKNGELNSFKE